MAEPSETLLTVLPVSVVHLVFDHLTVNDLLHRLQFSSKALHSLISEEFDMGITMEEENNGNEGNEEKSAGLRTSMDPHPGEDRRHRSYYWCQRWYAYLARNTQSIALVLPLAPSLRRYGANCTATTPSQPSQSSTRDNIGSGRVERYTALHRELQRFLAHRGQMLILADSYDQSIRREEDQEHGVGSTKGSNMNNEAHFTEEQWSICLPTLLPLPSNKQMDHGEEELFSSSSDSSWKILALRALGISQDEGTARHVDPNDDNAELIQDPDFLKVQNLLRLNTLLGEYFVQLLGSKASEVCALVTQQGRSSKESSSTQRRRTAQQSSLAVTQGSEQVYQMASTAIEATRRALQHGTLAVAPQKKPSGPTRVAAGAEGRPPPARGAESQAAGGSSSAGARRWRSTPSSTSEKTKNDSSSGGESSGSSGSSSDDGHQNKKNGRAPGKKKRPKKKLHIPSPTLARTLQWLLHSLEGCRSRPTCSSSSSSVLSRQQEVEAKCSTPPTKLQLLAACASPPPKTSAGGDGLGSCTIEAAQHDSSCGVSNACLGVNAAARSRSARVKPDYKLSTFESANGKDPLPFESRAHVRVLIHSLQASISTAYAYHHPRPAKPTSPATTEENSNNASIAAGGGPGRRTNPPPGAGRGQLLVEQPSRGLFFPVHALVPTESVESCLLRPGVSFIGSTSSDVGADNAVVHVEVGGHDTTTKKCEQQQGDEFILPVFRCLKVVDPSSEVPATLNHTETTTSSAETTKTPDEEPTRSDSPDFVEAGDDAQVGVAPLAPATSLPPLLPDVSVQLLETHYTPADLLLYRFLLTHTWVTSVQHHTWVDEEKLALLSRMVSPSGATVEFRFFFSELRGSHPRMFAKMWYCTSTMEKDDMIWKSKEPDANQTLLFTVGYGRVEVDFRPQPKMQGFDEVRELLQLPETFPLKLLWNAVVVASAGFRWLAPHSTMLHLYYGATLVDSFETALEKFRLERRQGEGKKQPRRE